MDYLNIYEVIYGIV